MKRIAQYTRGREKYDIQILEYDDETVRVKLEESTPFAEKGQTSWVDCDEVIGVMTDKG